MATATVTETTEVTVETEMAAVVEEVQEMGQHSSGNGEGMVTT